MRRRFRSHSFDMWGKPLYFFAVGGLIVLVLSQALLLKENPRRYLSWVDKIEGDPVSMQTPVAAGSPMIITENLTVVNRPNTSREHKTVIICMLRPAFNREVYILVNGNRSADLSNGDAQISVYEGDYIELDATRLKEQGQFIVKVGEPGVVSPQNGLVCEGKACLIPVGKVIFKH